MASLDFDLIAKRLTTTRLKSYLEATAEDVRAAIALYDWNISAASALYEDLGRLEVLFRNTVDEALVKYAAERAWPDVWYQQTQLFPRQKASRAREEIAAARKRAIRGGSLREVHGKVIAELSFGFWRYLCEPPYLTSLWVPALASSFPLHPSPGDPRQVRSDVADRMQRLHFLRNRIAHHEPVHRRDLSQDHANLLELSSWICADCCSWIDSSSRTHAVLDARPC